MRLFDHRIVDVVRSAVALLLLAAGPASAQTAQRLADFHSNEPLMLVEHPNGLLYGIAVGGSQEFGILFSMTPGGTVTPVHEFAGPPGDAYEPRQLIVGQDGNLYGTSERGGANNCGAIFTATPAGATSLVASFSCDELGNPLSPSDRLIGGTNGRAYVSTAFGGAFNQGSFYYVTAGASPTTVYDFPIASSSACGAPWVVTGVVDGRFYGSDGSCLFSMTLDGALVQLADIPGTARLALGRDGFVYSARLVGSCPQVTGDCDHDSIVSRVAPTGGAQDVASVAGWLAWLVQVADGSFVGASQTAHRSCLTEPPQPCMTYPGSQQFQRLSAGGSAEFAVDFTPTSAFVSASNGWLYGFGQGSSGTAAFGLLAPVSVPVVTVNGSAMVPDGMAAGTPSSWIATNSLLTTDVEYKFLVSSNVSGVGWRVVQDYSSDPVLRWSPAHAGFYLLQTWIRTHGSTAAWEGYQSTLGFRVAAPAAISLADVRASPSLPITTGAVTTFSAAATGGVGPLQYQFFVNEPITGWRVLQPWSADADVTWTPRVAGSYAVQVWVRSANSSAALEAWQGIDPFPVSAGPLTVTIDADRPLPIGPGATIAWTATPAGGDGSPLEFAFFRYREQTAAWTLVRPFAPAPTWSWTPAAGEIGTYWLQAWARRQGSGAVVEAWAGTAPFAVGGAPLAVSLASSQGNPTRVPALTPIRWRAAATGATGPLEYQFWRFDGRSGAWSLVQDYGTNDTYPWQPTLAEAGLWVLQVWVRAVGSAQPYQAWAGTDNILIEP